MEVKSETIQPRTKSKSKRARTKARSKRNNKMNSHLRGRENICQYSALPHLQRSFRDTEDDKYPYRPTQMSGPKNKTRKMNGIRKNRVIATEKPRWKTMYKLHSFRRRKTSTQAQSNLRNHSKRIPLTLRSIIPIQRSSFAFIPSTTQCLSTFSLTRF